MGDIQISKPVLIALIGAILVGGYMLYGSSQSGEEVIPPSPPAGPPGSTGATAGPTGTTGATGPTEIETAAERAKRRAKNRRAALRKQAREAGIPLDVFMARRRGKVSLIFFWEPRGKDDMHVNLAIKAVVSERKDVVLFRERITNKSRYDGVAQAAAISRTPAIVILYRDRADVHEGYIDPGTLNEIIAQLKSR